jgi:uncharacterized protein
MLDQSMRYIVERFPREDLSITFHGGEPLMAGTGFYQHAIPAIRAAAGERLRRVSVQSNLWLLTPELVDLFSENAVSLGTSLDGPEEINDRQRGAGYFRRTMRGLEMARRRGMRVGCIATLTALSAPNWRRILDFFEREGLDVSFHAALPGADTRSDELMLEPQAFGDILVDILHELLRRDIPIHIQPVDSAARGMLGLGGRSCVFDNCLGKFTAIGPDGGIYPCQRFVGMDEFLLGNVAMDHSQTIEDSPGWRLIAAWQEAREGVCSGCAAWQDCHGGCPYNAIAAVKELSAPPVGDPYCEAYRRMFTAITEQAASDFFHGENLNRLVEEPGQTAGLLRYGAFARRYSPTWHPNTAGL